MPFCVPMVWRVAERSRLLLLLHDKHQRMFSNKNKSKISYAVCKPAIKPIPHDPGLPVPQSPTEKEDTLSVDERASTGTESDEDLVQSDPSFQHECASLLINQERLNDLVRDLYLSKEKAEVLGPRLQQWNLLEPATTILSFRSRNENLARYYASAENICYCKDIHGKRFSFFRFFTALFS